MLRMKTFLFCFLLFSVLSCKPKAPSSTSSSSNKIGINTNGGWSDSPYISRDGKRLYFMYSRYNFAPWIKSGGTVTPIASGPDRPGLHKSNVNPFDESDIYMATKNQDGTWSEPVALGFNGAFGDSSGMEINNGNTFIWLRGNGTTNNIVMANKDGSGTWGAPVDLGADINDHSSGVLQDNPHLSEDGKALWFVSNRAGGIGGKDIWFSFNASGTINGTWTVPTNMGAPINTTGDEDQPWISPVSTDVFWNSPSGLTHCFSNGTTCNAAPTTVTVPGCNYVAEVSIPDDGNTMYFGCGNTTTFEVKIMYSEKQSDGSWGTAKLVD